MYIRGQRTDIKELVESKGLPWFLDNFMGVLMEAEGETPAILRPEDFSLQELYEAVDVSQFPVVTGQLISKKMIASYNLAARIGDRLVENMPSKKLVDRIPGFDLLGRIAKVNAGMPYDHSADIEEKWVQVEGNKYGEILDITEEAVMFDQTNSILRVAGQMGEDAAMFKEEIIVNTVQDITNYKAWYPANSQVDLYSNSTTSPHLFDNLITNIFANHTDINAALLLWAAMTNKRGRPINVVPKILLLPVALKMTASILLRSAVLLGASNATPNPVQNDYELLCSPYCDLQSTVYWYFGDFKKQFIWKEVIPLQVLRRGKESEEGWRRDLLASYKIRFYGTAAATDFKYVIKSTGAA